jgi:hypothetical protein
MLCCSYGSEGCININFRLHEAIDILERTPETLERFLSGLSEAWVQNNEGEHHLFSAFDRFSHLKEKSERTLEEALLKFKINQNVHVSINLTACPQ